MGNRCETLSFPDDSEYKCEIDRGWKSVEVVKKD